MDGRIELILRGQWAGDPTIGTRARGSAYHGERLMDPSGVAEFFASAHDSDESFADALVTANGFFAVVSRLRASLRIGVDVMRSIPLFYGVHGGCLFVSDDAREVRRRVGDASRGAAAEREFRLVGYVTQGETLYPSVKQLQAGEMMTAEFRDGRWDLKTRFYFRHMHTTYLTEGQSDHLRRLDSAVENAIARLVKYAGGRRILLPLSGGKDSRLIAMTLKRQGYGNVLCFTYGVPGNAESSVSEDVAKRLGYPWRFLPYSNAVLQEWFQSKARCALYRRADGLSSLPLFQDAPAIQMLIRDESIPGESVVAPGYAADLPAGSYSVGYPDLYAERQPAGEPAVDAIVECHYRLWPLTPADRALAYARVCEGLSPANCYQDAADMFEEWFTREKVAKFVCNAVRVYEDAGLDWWLPYFDREFLQFWLHVRPKWRLGQRLYAKYLREREMREIGHAYDSGKSGSLALLRGRTRRTLARLGLLNRYDGRRERRRAASARKVYEGHPLALLGVIPWSTFSEHYTGRETINSFLAQSYLEEEVD